MDHNAGGRVVFGNLQYCLPRARARSSACRRTVTEQTGHENHGNFSTFGIAYESSSRPCLRVRLTIGPRADCPAVYKSLLLSARARICEETLSRQRAVGFNRLVRLHRVDNYVERGVS